MHKKSFASALALEWFWYANYFIFLQLVSFSILIILAKRLTTETEKYLEKCALSVLHVKLHMQCEYGTHPLHIQFTVNWAVA